MIASSLALAGATFLSACDHGTAPLPAASIEIFPSGPLTLEAVGDTFRLLARVRDEAGAPLTTPVSWSSGDPAVVTVDGGGLLTARRDGVAEVEARTGDELQATVAVLVTPPSGGDASFEEVGVGVFSARSLSDIWVHGDHAYTGTHARSGCDVTAPSDRCGNLLAVWDVSDPAAPLLLDTLVLDARVVNDVKVSADGALLVATHEGSADMLNGISLFDLVDPAAPTPVARYTEDLTSGVHNVWIEEIDGRDYVFVAVDGSSPLAGLRIVDVTDPAAPEEVAHFYAGSSFLHDVYVRDGLAFLSHWDAGLVILDVGNGMRGGSPGNPVEVSRIVTEGGNVHNAWYWPAAGRVFVGQEEFLQAGEPVDSLGVVHVVDASDPARLREVATVRAPEATPHNFWLDEAGEVLFVGWYQAGLRAVDVSGELAGSLEDQGRMLAFVRPEGPLASGNVWAPQLHGDHVWVSDRFNGIRSYRFRRGGA